MNRTAWTVAAGLALSLLAGAAFAAHNIVTVSVSSSTRDQITGAVQVKNTIPPAQTGTVTLLVFEVKEDGRVQERDRQNLGQVTVPAGAGSVAPPVPFTVDTHQGFFKKGSFIVLADFNNPAVAHTHCGTVTVNRDF